MKSASGPIGVTDKRREKNRKKRGGGRGEWNGRKTKANQEQMRKQRHQRYRCREAEPIYFKIM